MQHLLTIEGMHCGGCSSRIEKMVNQLPDTHISVDLEAAQATVTFTQKSEIQVVIDKIETLGYKAQLFK